jgi:prepilin-type N-terminal cleavage/methylation domain-containing protein
MNSRLPLSPAEGGYTLIELLVAMAIGLGLLAAVGSLLVGAMRTQPKVGEKANEVQLARAALERITTELRNGTVVDVATASSVSFQAYVRRTSCGSSTLPSATAPSIKCQVTITCTAAPQACVRRQAAPGEVGKGTPQTIFTGLSNGSSVFSYWPLSSPSPTYVKVTLALPDPTGGKDALTVSDGATLRNTVLTN